MGGKKLGKKQFGKTVRKRNNGEQWRNSIVRIKEILECLERVTSYCQAEVIG